MNQRIFRGFPFAVLLHLLLPGLAHALYREYLFGIFVFLIMQLGVVLTIVSCLVTIPTIAKIVLLGLPLFFYLFSFLDLKRTVRDKGARFVSQPNIVAVAVVAALAYQIFAPISLGHFAWMNRPEFFTGTSSDYSPTVSRGNIASANKLAYFVSIPFMDRAILHALPDRFDLVRYFDETGEHKVGLVVGLPGEDVSCTDGLYSSGEIITPMPHVGSGAITGGWPLTLVDGNSILVADVKLGSVSSVSQISLAALIGRVGHLSP